jgi:drug/metabolite transporter (DMT)-like permease
MQNRSAPGMIFLCLGVLVFSLQDAIIKLVSGEFPVTEAVYIRSLVAVPLLAWFVHVEAGIGAIASPRFWWLTLRACALFISYTAYYLAFPALPLADAVALYFTAPLFITALAGPFLGEKVGWRSWAAIIAGLAGVVIMLRPGSSLFEPAALFSLLSAFLYGSSALMTRRLGVTEPASVMAFYQNIVFLAGAGCVALILQITGIHEAKHPSLDFLVRPWTIPNGSDFMLMAGCGVIAAIGTMLLTHAYRIAEANLVSSFEYTGILWVPLWGFLLFGEVPRWSTVVGAALIVGSGIIALRRRDERQRAIGAAPSVPHPINAATTENLLATLHNIAVLKSEEERLFDADHVEQLCDLGYVVALGTGRYTITGEGKAVLKKAYS